ncbi:PHD finger protein [Dorcoceras hygrometricum]|uniref:PHD finger protein n=1 Tax=Dorcoceras hygrometricum TaxID=472368 RepID=A0A2Z7BRD3_9LAMI|nr:PHD finger protein [Dorcoceras hygrometricum]
MVVTRSGVARVKRKMVLASSDSVSTASMEMPVPMNRARSQRPKKIKPLRAIPGDFTTAKEGTIPEAAGDVGDSGSPCAEAQAAHADEWMASAGPHLEDSFMHWSGGPWCDSRMLLITTSDNSSVNVIVQSALTQIPVTTAEHEASNCNKKSDIESYVKHDFQQFNKVFYHKLDDLLASVTQAQNSTELQRDMNTNHHKLSDEVTTLSSQMAEFIDC